MKSHTASKLDRTDYRSAKGIASWWAKDGVWHIALPCPEIVDGLSTGGFRWTDAIYDSREEAVAAIG